MTDSKYASILQIKKQITQLFLTLAVYDNMTKHFSVTLKTSNFLGNKDRKIHQICTKYLRTLFILRNICYILYKNEFNYGMVKCSGLSIPMCTQFSNIEFWFRTA